MTGAEHYARAEEALASVAEIADLINQAIEAGQLKTLPDVSAMVKIPDLALSIAQIHATLALAAASAYPAIRGYVGDENDDGRDWTKVTAPKRVPS